MKSEGLCQAVMVFHLCSGVGRQFHWITGLSVSLLGAAGCWPLSLSLCCLLVSCF